MKNWIFLLLLFPLLTGCSNDAAEKIANEFHNRMESEDYPYIVEHLIDTETSTMEEWTEFFSVIKSWGKQHNRINKSNYNFKTNNGVTTVKLAYTFEVDGFDTMHERLILINRGKGYKIMTVLINTDESVVIEGSKNF